MNEPTRTDDPARVHFGLEQWRRTRIGRARIPEPLWRAAIDLARHYPAMRVARELGMSPSLRHRRLRAKCSAEDGSSPTPHRFVEIAPRLHENVDLSARMVSLGARCVDRWAMAAWCVIREFPRKLAFFWTRR